MARKSFSAQVRGFRQDVLGPGGLAEQAVRKIVLTMFSEVIQMSPVDTGRFRGNWQTAVGTAPTGIVELLDKDGAVVIAKVQGEVDGLKVGDTIFMVNNLPYAIPLEEGHSQQAPAGMVGLTVQRFIPVVDQVARALSR